MTRFDSILIANRGEIALRIARTARALGHRVIAVYSDADVDALHVKAADEAWHIGPSNPSDSYLNIERLCETIRASRAGAVHPGYGFLSENAVFARACAEAGAVFIGPSPEAIRLMGNKAEAKRRMIAAGVPCVPGFADTDDTDDALIEAAAAIGLPVMIKAAAGGGGRGIRLVSSMESIADAIQSARSEALAGFGSAELIVEKYIERPRHVEIQVIADTHGHIVHLGERDCSVQRRHQKVIEEAPCPSMTPELRDRMGAAAVRAAASVGYTGAGTVEFLLDKDRSFYFLEMNTRIQVEHPVTEMVTGLDIVAMQIAVAQGHKLPVDQADVAMHGHAIEARLYAEDPDRDHLPSTGRILAWDVPEIEGVRVDAGVSTGQNVTPFYDPMLAKLIAHGPDRQMAVARLAAALASLQCLGLRTNRSYLHRLVSTPVFQAGDATTSFIADHADKLRPPAQATPPALLAIAAALARLRLRDSLSGSISAELLDWSSGAALRQTWAFRDQPPVEMTVGGDGLHLIDVGDARFRLTLKRRNGSEAELTLDGCQAPVRFAFTDDGALHLSWRGEEAWLEPAPLPEQAAREAGENNLRAPMHGRVIRLLAAAGDPVCEGAPLLIVEAMKMEQKITAPRDGTVAALFVEEGAQVAAGDLLLAFEAGE